MIQKKTLLHTIISSRKSTRNNTFHIINDSIFSRVSTNVVTDVAVIVYLDCTKKVQVTIACAECIAQGKFLSWAQAAILGRL